MSDILSSRWIIHTNSFKSFSITSSLDFNSSSSPDPISGSDSGMSKVKLSFKGGIMLFNTMGDVGGSSADVEDYVRFIYWTETVYISQQLSRNGGLRLNVTNSCHSYIKVRGATFRSSNIKAILQHVGLFCVGGISLCCRVTFFVLEYCLKSASCLAITAR